MKWVTRERPKIDRIACPWLIARFIDKPALAQLAAIVRGADTRCRSVWRDSTRTITSCCGTA